MTSNCLQPQTNYETASPAYKKVQDIHTKHFLDICIFSCMFCMLSIYFISLNKCFMSRPGHIASLCEQFPPLWGHFAQHFGLYTSLCRHFASLCNTFTSYCSHCAPFCIHSPTYGYFLAQGSHFVVAFLIWFLTLNVNTSYRGCGSGGKSEFQGRPLSPLANPLLLVAYLNWEKPQRRRRRRRERNKNMERGEGGVWGGKLNKLSGFNNVLPPDKLLASPATLILPAHNPCSQPWQQFPSAMGRPGNGALSPWEQQARRIEDMESWEM